MTACKTIVFIAAVLLTVSGPVRANGHLPTLPMPEMTDDGMHAQEWFYESFLDLRDDLAATRQEGKRLVIFWEQRGCPYCKRMHEVNLRIPRIVEKIKNSFNVINLDIWGARKVTDLDGAVLAEKELANKYRILYTPTLQFLPESLENVAGRNGKESEVLRIAGYFKPFHFYFLFHYVQSKGYESQPNFQRWLSAIGKGLMEKNIKYDLWADALPPNLPKKY